MKLYATGFNAWNQLTFHNDTGDEEPEDVAQFQCVLEDRHIESPYASLSCTVGTGLTLTAENRRCGAKRIRVYLANTASGLAMAGSPEAWLQKPSLRAGLLSSTAAVAGNATIAVYDGDQTIDQYQSITQLEKGSPCQSFRGLRGIIQIVAYETGFGALSKEGQVWTWGDERYGACLGRETSQTPANEPGLVDDLDDLPTGKIRKIAASGYLLMALTTGDDLYAWGGHPGGRSIILEEMSKHPAPIVIEDHDIADCAIGQSHALLLTTSGDIFAAGDNAHGQLGIPGDAITSWTQVPAIIGGNDAPMTAVAVACGPRNAFVLCKS